jgi:hypothetical protein
LTPVFCLHCGEDAPGAQCYLSSDASTGNLITTSGERSAAGAAALLPPVQDDASEHRLTFTRQVPLPGVAHRPASLLQAQLFRRSDVWPVCWCHPFAVIVGEIAQSLRTSSCSGVAHLLSHSHVVQLLIIVESCILPARCEDAPPVRPASLSCRLPLARYAHHRVISSSAWVCSCHRCQLTTGS